ALVVAAAVAAAVILTRGGSSVAVAANSVAVIDPASNKVVADITGVGTKPGEIVASRNALWVASSSQQGVVEINPRTRKVVKTLGLGFAPSHLAVGGGSLWATSGRSGTVMAIDLRSGTHGDAIQLPGVNGGLASADGIAVSAGRVFVYDRSDLA